MGQRYQSRSENGDALIELRRDNNGAWLVEARTIGSAEPPLKVIFSGKAARKEALALLSVVQSTVSRRAAARA
jgi:hypothetical protein